MFAAPHPSRRRPGIKVRLAGWLLALLGLAQPALLWADGILVRTNRTTGPYATVIDALRTALADHIELIVTDTETPFTQAAGAQGRIRAILALGTAANQAALNDPPELPLFGLLMTRPALVALQQQAPRRRIGGLYIEHPLSTQIEVARRVFPQLDSFGVLHSDLMPLEKPETGVPVVIRPYDFEGNLQLSLRSLLTGVDGLVAIPDPEVFNQNTIHAVLLTAYRLNKPVIGYSRPYVAAGALVAAYSPPASIGREAGRTVLQWLQGGEWPGMRYPVAFSVAINQRVASVLGLRAVIEPEPEAVFERLEQLR